MSGDSTRLERQKLYEEVWLTYMVRLAKKYGLSDRGLAKIWRLQRVSRHDGNHYKTAAEPVPISKGL